jgi:tetratricopeptide (TPR) repeat protein
MNLAAVEILSGHYADAQTDLQTLALSARARNDDASLALVQQNLAEALVRDGKAARALVVARESVAGSDKVFGASSRRGAGARVTLGNVYVALARPELARRSYDEAIRMFEHVIGPDTSELGEPLIGLGELERNPKAARGLLERAVRVLAQADPIDLARAEFALAKTLFALGERDDAARTARLAADLYRRTGTRGAARVTQVESWIAAAR